MPEDLKSEWAGLPGCLQKYHQDERVGGHYADMVGKNTTKTREHIKHQMDKDKMGEHLSIPYPGSPFTDRM